MGREHLCALQLERLRALLARVKEQVPLYQRRLAGVHPEQITSMDDLRRLPFTRKDDLRDTYPFGLLAVPREEIVRIHASSGTTGKLTVVAYTARDVELFARVNARSLAMAGAEPGMILHNAYGYGLFTGGLGIHYGGERLGLAVVPVVNGVCKGCHMAIPPQLYNIIQRGLSMETCPSCNRIIYWEELMKDKQLEEGEK